MKLENSGSSKVQHKPARVQVCQPSELQDDFHLKAARKKAALLNVERRIEHVELLLNRYNEKYDC